MKRKYFKTLKEVMIYLNERSPFKNSYPYYFLCTTEKFDEAILSGMTENCKFWKQSPNSYNRLNKTFICCRCKDKESYDLIRGFLSVIEDQKLFLEEFEQYIVELKCKIYIYENAADHKNEIRLENPDIYINFH